MKQLIPILLTAVVFCIAGCQGRNWHEDMSVLDHIDSLFAHNDFQHAYDTVLAIESQMPGKSESTRMRFELQKIKAIDKLGKPLLTDSIILPIIDYYEKEGDKRYLPEAYYYAGRTYASLNDAQRGLEYFNKALDVVNKEENYLLSRIHSQKGYLRYNNGIYAEAIAEHQNSYDYSLQESDSLGMIHSSRDIGNCYIVKGDYDDALFYFDNGEMLATLVNDSSFISLIGIDKTNTYTNMAEYRLAEKYLNQSIANVDSQFLNYAIGIAGYLYFKQKKYDLAKSYYNKLLNSQSIYSRQRGEAMLLSMAANEKDIDEVIKHVVPYKELTDSISRITDSEKIARINSLYNSRRLERDKEALEKQNLRYTYYIIIGSLLLVIIIAASVTYTYRFRSERNRLKYNNAMLDQYIKEERRKRAQIEQERDRLVEVNMMEKLKQEQGDEKKNSIRESAIFLRLITTTRAMSLQDKKEVEELLNHTYPDFITRLHSLGVTKEHELDICMLLKMGFTPSRMAILLSHSQSAITNTRKKLYTKVTGKQGKASDWDGIVFGL